MPRGETPLKIAVIGSGIAGLGAAWLLSHRHDVAIFDKESRIGGHANPVTVSWMHRDIVVDTGFIVFNETNYPNLTKLFRHLGVETQMSDMSLAISLETGDREYAGDGLQRIFAQKSHLFDRRFLAMLYGILRFYREAPQDCSSLADEITIGEYLRVKRFGRSFCDDHLLPMASAIWSAPSREMLSYPARSFIEFYENHGLLRLTGRTSWRTVVGSSRTYLSALSDSLSHRIYLGREICRVSRKFNQLVVTDRKGEQHNFDHVVVATHADDAARLVDNSAMPISALLQRFRYSSNRAVLHSDAALMPRRRAVWSSWNVLDAGGEKPPVITYWMNRLQSLPDDPPLFLTLNPSAEPAKTHYETYYRHPIFDREGLSARRRLEALKGHAGLWFCGSYFGNGFHEDALHSGLTVAEAIDPACRRPWKSRPELEPNVTLQRPRSVAAS